ncbi:hypothetical protein FGB62_152g00 [Gracilaria domingensis]|nr:hypothetical protein FGB62_152g00 [Gracilaria domingensis]
MSTAFMDPEAIQAFDLEQIEPDGISNLYSAPKSTHLTEDEQKTTPFAETQTAALSPTENEALSRNTRQHFKTQMGYCTCSEPCANDQHLTLATGFASMSQEHRSNTVRGMLLALSAPSGRENELMSWDTHHAQDRKAKRRKTGSSSSHVTTCYATKGHRMCMYGYAATVQLHPRTIRQFALEVSTATEYKWKENEHSKGRKGRLYLQSLVALAFLRRYAQVNAFCCSTGRGSSTERPIQWLPNDVRR